MKIHIKRGVLKEIERRARQSYPLEVIGFLVGRPGSGIKYPMTVTGVVWPRQIRETDHVYAMKGEYRKACRDATVLGTVHSHPDSDSPLPSGEDHCDDADRRLMAIISVFKKGVGGETATLGTRIMFWEPMKEIKVREVR